MGQSLGFDPKVIIIRLMKLLQNPDYVEELRAKLELLRGFGIKKWGKRERMPQKLRKLVPEKNRDLLSWRSK